MRPTVKNWGLAFMIDRSRVDAQRDRKRIIDEFTEFMNSDEITEIWFIGNVNLYGHFYGRPRRENKTYSKDGSFSHSANIDTVRKENGKYVFTSKFGKEFEVECNDYCRDLERMIEDNKNGCLSNLHGSYLFDYEKGNERKLYI